MTLPIDTVISSRSSRRTISTATVGIRGPAGPTGATQSALDLKAPLDSPTFTGTVGGITKSMVGLGNVDNTSDLNKPVSTATQSALDLKVDDTEKGAANGVATLDASGDVPITQINLPSSTVSANAAATTTSTTPVLLTEMTITPGAGTYMVVFGSDFTLGSNSQFITTSIYINGVQDSGSTRSAGVIATNARVVITTFAVAVVAAGQTIEGRWQVNSGTGTSTNRSLRLVRIA